MPLRLKSDLVIIFPSRKKTIDSSFALFLLARKRGFFIILKDIFNKGRNMNNTKKLAGLVIVAVIALAGVWVFNYAGDENESANNEVTQVQEVVEESPKATVSEDGETISYDGVEGQTALALLKQYTEVETEEFTGLGEYVTGINGLVADSSANYWSFYVIGEAAQVGAGDYVTKEGDTIEWRLEDVSTFDQ